MAPHCQGIFQRRLSWSEIKKGSRGSTLAFIRIRTRIDRKPPLPELHTTLLGLCNISVYLWNVCECVLVYECVHTRELIDRNLWGFLSALFGDHHFGDDDDHTSHSDDRGFTART